jgi:FMN phosphatase YigB (HAD superfamily)
MAEMEALVQPGADRYGHFPGGEREFWARFSRSTLQKAIGRAPDDGLAARALGALRAAFTRPDAWHVFPDVVPALKALREAGVRLAAVSNWDSRLPDLLRGLGLHDYFGVLAVSHLLGVEKPAPGIFAGVDGLLLDRRGVLDPALAPLRDLGDLPRIAREGLPTV